MMNTQKLKNEAFKEIENNKQPIIELGRSVFNEPEEGFCEHRTAKKVETFFKDWGIRTQSGLAITGVKGYLEGTREGPCIALLGELDALFNRDHPKADKESGLVHACGHFAQLAGLVGAGFGLKKIIAELPGRVVLFAVPAEEFVNLEFRQKLKEKGETNYFGGKQELVRLGALDDVDLVLMQHAQSDIPGKSAFISGGSNGFVGKTVRFLGRAAHAGVAPFKGINALNAFHLALAAIHAQRETFRDEDAVRVHMIITKGGDAVNVVPGEVRVEMYVRAKTIEAMKDINAKVDRALRSGAMGVGAKVEITNTAGYLPIRGNERLTQCWKKNAEAILGRENVHFMDAWGGSTDMGDLTHLMPGIHPFVGAFSGDLHSKDFEATDEEMAFITSAKILTATVIDLLVDDAKEARAVIDHFQPKLKKKEYLNLLDSLSYRQLWESD
jgi:amidohydrolase